MGDCSFRYCGASIGDPTGSNLTNSFQGIPWGALAAPLYLLVFDGATESTNLAFRLMILGTDIRPSVHIDSCLWDSVQFGTRKSSACGASNSLHS